MYIENDAIGLVVKSCPSMAKCISVIRKYRPISMAEIKKDIETGHYVFECEYINTSGLQMLRKCYDELVKLGAVVEIYEQGRLTTRQFISNLIGSYRSIERETEMMIDLEVGDDEE